MRKDNIHVIHLKALKGRLCPFYNTIFPNQTKKESKSVLSSGKFQFQFILVTSFSSLGFLSPLFSNSKNNYTQLEIYKKRKKRKEKTTVGKLLTVSEKVHHHSGYSPSSTKIVL